MESLSTVFRRASQKVFKIAFRRAIISVFLMILASSVLAVEKDKTNLKKKKSVNTSDLYRDWRRGCYQNVTVQGKSKKNIVAICNCIERQMKSDKIERRELQILAWYYNNSAELADEEFKPENESLFEYDSHLTTACRKNPSR